MEYEYRSSMRCLFFFLVFSYLYLFDLFLICLANGSPREEPVQGPHFFVSQYFRTGAKNFFLKKEDEGKKKKKRDESGARETHQAIDDSCFVVVVGSFLFFFSSQILVLLSSLLVHAKANPQN